VQIRRFIVSLLCLSVLVIRRLLRKRDLRDNLKVDQQRELILDPGIITRFRLMSFLSIKAS
jgi:hypothetical protein